LRGLSLSVLAARQVSGRVETEWLLGAIDRRFRIVPIFRDPDGLIVAELRAR
jgi:hypothetical protein